MFGADIAALMGLFGLTSAFGVIGLAFACWMAWRIVEKAGFPGWAGLVTVLLTLTAVGTIVPLVLLWVFAFMRWPRDAVGGTRAALPPPTAALGRLPDRRGWRLVGTVPPTGEISFVIDATTTSYVLTGAPAARPNELSVPDPSVGQPHARLLVASARLGLEDLGSPGGTYIDGARLLPEHGPRDITASRTIRVGKIELALSKI
jgi:hypothetical protein